MPCVYYGDENLAEGYSDPFCRKCFDWENLNDDMIAYYRRLGEIRTKFSEIFKEGEFKEIFIQNGCFIFKRELAEQSVYVYVNNTSEEYYVCFSGKYYEYLRNHSFENILEIKRYSYGLFYKEN